MQQALIETSHTLSSNSGPTKLPSWEPGPASQYQGAIAMNHVCEHLYLDLFCVPVSKMCPKVIVPSLCTILAYEKLNKKALLLISGEEGHIYIYKS